MRCQLLVALVLIAASAIALSSADAGEPGDYKLEGKAYFLYHQDASDGDGQTNAFDITRMYFGIKYSIAEDLMIRYLTDIAHEVGGGRFLAFAKYAYLDWSLQGNRHLLMGLQGTDNWSQPEKAWGYRPIQFSPMEAFGKYWGSWASAYSVLLAAGIADSTTSSADVARLSRIRSNFNTARRSKMGSSADLGLGFKFKPNDTAYVNLMIRNGLGYKRTEDDRYKNLQVRSGVHLMEKALHLSGFLEIEPWKGVDASGAAKRYMNLQWDVMAVLTSNDKYTVGVDANSKTFAGIEEITALCFSAFGHAFVQPEKVKVIGRYDLYDTGLDDATVLSGQPQMDSNGNRIIVGVDFKVHQKFSIIPNFQRVGFDSSDEAAINSLFIHFYFKL